MTHFQSLQPTIKWAASRSFLQGLSLQQFSSLASPVLETQSPKPKPASTHGPASRDPRPHQGGLAWPLSLDTFPQFFTWSPGKRKSGRSRRISSGKRNSRSGCERWAMTRANWHLGNARSSSRKGTSLNTRHRMELGGPQTLPPWVDPPPCTLLPLHPSPSTQPLFPRKSLLVGIGARHQRGWGRPLACGARPSPPPAPRNPLGSCILGWA